MRARRLKFTQAIAAVVMQNDGIDLPYIESVTQNMLVNEIVRDGYLPSCLRWNRVEGSNQTTHCD